MTLTRDQILAKRNDLPTTEVDIPELGGTVKIRTLTLKEMREIHKLQKANTETLSVYPKLVAMGCIDDEGRPLFVGEDVALINDLPWAATDAIAKAVFRFNKVGDEDDKKKAEGESENGVPKE